MNQNQRDAHFSQMVEEELAERTVTAIARKNIEFALAHQNDSLEQLKKYLQGLRKEAWTDADKDRDHRRRIY